MGIRTSRGHWHRFPDVAGHDVDRTRTWDRRFLASITVASRSQMEGRTNVHCRDAQRVRPLLGGCGRAKRRSGNEGQPSTTHSENQLDRCAFPQLDCSTDAQWRQHCRNAQQTEGVAWGREWPMALHGVSVLIGESEIVIFITSLQRAMEAAGAVVACNPAKRNSTATSYSFAAALLNVGHGALHEVCQCCSSRERPHRSPSSHPYSLTDLQRLLGTGG